MAAGLFDPTAVPAGWWDETAQPAGWWNRDLLDNAAAAATAVARVPTIQQEKRPRQVVAIAVVNLLLSTLAPVATVPPFIPQAQASAPEYRWQNADTSAGMAQVLRAVVVAEPPVVVTPHITPIKSKWLPGDTSRGIPKPLTQDAQLPFFITQHSAPDRLRPVVDTSQKQPITLQVIVPPAPIANVPFTQPYRGQWSINDTSAGSPATLQIVVGAQPQVTNTLEFAAQFKGGRWSAQPLDTSSGTPVIIAFPPAISPTVTHSGVGFSGVSLPKRDSVHKIEQESVSYKEII